ncbi:hypothetical protein VTP01DRAFT_2707 [Rhizomucor pusillus]|uniref:uncharacterized protein n=1 Tax=Rhizomucor pusillus TaxID=4840 RepID=UPI0037425118
MMTTSTTTTDPSPKPWRVAFLAEHDMFRCSPKFSSLSTSPPSAAAPPPLPSTITTTAAAAAAATSTAPRRLSSGSACETCRRRKTKCDGGQPCAYCASNRIECLHRPSKKRSTHQLYKVSEFRSRGIMKQASCPSFLAARRASSSSPSSSAMIGNATDRPVTKEEIPSMMDQLSCRTFSAVTLAAVDRSPNYPIYPLSPPPPASSHHYNRRGYASD